jgi:hypothetical protein
VPQRHRSWELTADQLAAALAVIQAALGTAANEGVDESQPGWSRRGECHTYRGRQEQQPRSHQYKVGIRSLLNCVE